MKENTRSQPGQNLSGHRQNPCFDASPASGSRATASVFPIRSTARNSGRPRLRCLVSVRCERGRATLRRVRVWYGEVGDGLEVGGGSEGRRYVR